MRTREEESRAEKVDSVTLKPVSVFVFVSSSLDMTWKKCCMQAGDEGGQVATGAYPGGALVTVPHDTAFVVVDISSSQASLPLPSFLRMSLPFLNT